MRIKLFLLLLILCFNKNIIAQDKIEVSYSQKNDSISFYFKNKTCDSLFLFTSYLEKETQSSPYLHRIDKKRKIYKVSYAPMVEFLAPYLSDRIMLGANKIITLGQIKYNFERIAPNEEIMLQLSIDDIFRNLEKKSNVIKDFSGRNPSIKTRMVTYKHKKKKFNLIFEFAYYLDISLLIDKEIYINNRNKLDNCTAKHSLIKVNIPFW